MRYHVDCPYCGNEQSLPDYALWPDESDAPEYPDPSVAEPCNSCPGWMRIVMQGETVTVQKAEPRYWQEYDCPVSGIDFDICPPIADGECFYCAGCRDWHVAGEDVQLQRLPITVLPVD